MTQAVCTYPRCKCIVSTSTSQPEPTCPLGLERDAAEQHGELQQRLQALYARSRRATHPAVVAEYERAISLLEQQASTLLH